MIQCIDVTKNLSTLDGLAVGDSFVSVEIVYSFLVEVYLRPESKCDLYVDPVKNNSTSSSGLNVFFLSLKTHAKPNIVA